MEMKAQYFFLSKEQRKERKRRGLYTLGSKTREPAGPFFLLPHIKIVSDFCGVFFSAQTPAGTAATTAETKAETGTKTESETETESTRSAGRATQQ